MYHEKELFTPGVCLRRFSGPRIVELDLGGIISSYCRIVSTVTRSS